MLYFSRVLLLLINLDQKSVSNWFVLKNPFNFNSFSQNVENDTINLLPAQVHFEPGLSLKTLQLMAEKSWDKVQDGLTLADIENILFFILFMRFIILAIRYNLKTSF